ncbi:uncharacterized protein F5147DRAFT_2263 [Suillus discolor]|uniref:Uncharacterized protein n=1 Tax=Suillus discolor TaxID=1912936 RepID=A0A9P7K0S5_9AGAM|nr:uncharacterized protein F5147DRAFT_2263 [Suillus discolor]KAG2120514.1 hypothetical protein F5147DRAFT_2263 [Suillus discolor]
MLWSRVFSSCLSNQLLMMSRDHRPDPGGAPVGENPSQPRSGVKQGIRKFVRRVTKIHSKPFKSSRNRIPANQNVDLRDASTTVVQNVETEGASSSQKVDSSNDNKHPTTSEIPSDSVNHGLSEEPAPQVQANPSGEEEGPDPQLVDAELQGACGSTQSMGLLGKHATSMASAANNVPGGLAAATNNFETKYLQPLKIIDGVLEKIGDIHPYAKMALGVLSTASKGERDQSIISLLQKLAEVYHFMTQDDSLEKIESMRGIVGKIVQQTHECARFIRDYSETKSFCGSPSYRTSCMNLIVLS